MNPSEERTLGNSKRRSEIHLVVERRAVQSEEGIGGEVKAMSREPGEELLNTCWLGTSRTQELAGTATQS